MGFYESPINRFCMERRFDQDKVSVVIPTYNQVNFARNTIESVLAQTYKNLEIVLADDCSTDGTIDILMEFAERDNRVKLLLSDNNQGIPANFNKAFDAVSGKAPRTRLS